MTDHIKEIQTSKYLIAYLDILGIRERLSSKDENIRKFHLSVLNHFVEQAKKGCGSAEYLLDDIDIVCYSDNLLFAYDTTKANNQYDYIHKCHCLIVYVLCMQELALANGFMVRGSVLFGDLYIDKEKNFVCGKGLIDVYLQESQLAIYPRIITKDEELLSIIEDISLGGGSKLKNILRKDFDNIYYIDYLQMLATTKDLPVQLKDMQERYQKDFVKERTNPKIIQKHDWHINYFNNFCDRVSLPEYKIEVANASN